MKWPRLANLNLMTKVPLTITFVVFSAALIIGLVVIERDWNRQRHALEAQSLALARASAAAGRTAIMSRDVWTLYQLLKQLRERDPADTGLALMVEAAFLDTDGTVLAHTDPERNPVGLPLRADDEVSAARLSHTLQSETAHLLPPDLRSEGFVEAVVPIRVDGLTVGFLVFRGSTARLIEQLRWDTAVVLIFALGLAGFMSIFGTLMSWRMVGPLKQLSEGLDAVSRGDLHKVQPVAPIDEDEIGHLTGQFNRMVAELVEKKRLEKELASAERLLGLGRFAAGLAHEVNNPLGGMMNCVKMMSQNPDDTRLVRKYLPLLDTGLRRISTTMQALLGELRGENQKSPCGAGCLTDLEAIVRSEIADRPIALDWQIEFGDMFGNAISCTCPHIHQIVMNLARNAIAAMPDGGKLAFVSRRIDGRLVIEVSDTGPGLDADTQERLFEPFFTTKQSGTGLGLWITYRIVEGMNGNIRVDSAPGEGARFTVTLPLISAVGKLQRNVTHAA